MNKYSNELESKVISCLSVYSRFRKDLYKMIVPYVFSENEDFFVLNFSQKFEDLANVAKQNFIYKFEELQKSVIEAGSKIAFEHPDPTDPGIDQRDSEKILSYAVSALKRAKINVSNQFFSDIDQAGNAIRRFRLKKQMMQKAGLHLEAIAQERDSFINEFKTVRRDALGRARDSEQFVMTELSFVTYKTANVMTMFYLSLMGEDRAKVSRPGHKYDGIEFEILSFDEIEKEVFNPNARALVLPV